MSYYLNTVAGATDSWTLSSVTFVLVIIFSFYIGTPTYESWTLARAFPLGGFLSCVTSFGGSFWQHRLLEYEDVIFNPTPKWLIYYQRRSPGMVYSMEHDKDTMSEVDRWERNERWFVEGVERTVNEKIDNYDGGYTYMVMVGCPYIMFLVIWVVILGRFSETTVVLWACRIPYLPFLGPILSMIAALMAGYGSAPYSKNYAFRVSQRPAGIEFTKGIPQIFELSNLATSLLNSAQGPISRNFILTENPYPKTQHPDKSLAYVVVSLASSAGAWNFWNVAARILSIVSMLLNVVVISTSTYLVPGEIISTALAYGYLVLVSRIASLSMVVQLSSKALGRFPIHHVVVKDKMELEVMLKQVMRMKLQMEINGRVFVDGREVAGYLEWTWWGSYLGLLGRPFDIRRGVNN